MTTRVHEDETAPRAERFRVLREDPAHDHRWITTESFPTAKEAHAFARGFTLGNAYGKDGTA
jgi:hypothetical protein